VFSFPFLDFSLAKVQIITIISNFYYDQNAEKMHFLKWIKWMMVLPIFSATFVRIKKKVARIFALMCFFS